MVAPTEVERGIIFVRDLVERDAKFARHSTYTANSPAFLQDYPKYLAKRRFFNKITVDFSHAI